MTVQSNPASPVERDAAPHEWAPRFALGWAMLVFAFAVLLLGYPALGGGFLVSPHSDQFIAGFAFREFAAYAMGGNVAGLVSPAHDGKLYISALFPLTLLLVLRGVQDGRRWAWGALAIVIGLAVLSPHPQLLQYLSLASGAFAVDVAFAAFGGVKLERRTALRRLGSALIVSENYYPGWSATVDGRSAPLGRVQYTLIGVELPAGARNVVLSFDSAPYRTGEMITLIALVSAGVWWLLGAFMERRQRV